MSLGRKFYTNYTATSLRGGAGGVGTPLQIGDLSLVLQSGDGARYPQAPFLIEIGSSKANEPHELILCTMIVGDVLAIRRGQENTTEQNWVVGSPICQVISAGGLGDIWDRIQSIGVMPEDYGAAGDGATDDTAALQAALNATPAGGACVLGAKTYAISSPLTLPPGVTLLGPVLGRRVDQVSTEVPIAAKIKCLPGFLGAAAILLLDKEQGGYSGDNNGSRIVGVNLDGSAIASGSVDGIKATGLVHDVIISNVWIYSFSHNGLTTSSYTRLDSSTPHPYSWVMHDVAAHNCQNNGFSLNGLTDSDLLEVHALGSGAHGFFLATMANSHVVSCHAEWSTQHGYYVTGGWGTGTGPGGAVFSACTTDRNGHNGFYVDATGNGTLRFVGCEARRDGRNGGAGGSGYAGFATNGSTMPIVLDLVTYPGVDDDGSGTASPDYGASFASSANISVIGGHLHGVLAGWHDSGGNTFLRRAMNVMESTGPTSSPSRVASTPWTTNGQGTVALTNNDETAFTVSNSGTNANDPLFDALTAASAGAGIETSKVMGDTTNRYKRFVDGKQEWGSGSATRDTNLYRSGVGTLATDNSLDVVLHALGIATPREHGYAGWVYDSAHITSGKAGTAGTLYLAAVYISRSVTVSKIYWGINSAGSGATAGQNFVGLYKSDGTLLASAGVDSAVTATGMQTTTISATALTPGLYWVAFLFNATGMPQIYRAQDLNATLLNGGILSASSYRFATNGTGLTALPSPITPSSNTAAQFSYWAALG